MRLAALGQRVLLIEADERPPRRLAGEWLHPPAVRFLESLGLCLSEIDAAPGRGFVMHPDDDSEPIPLRYPGSPGMSVEHGRLVSWMRRAATERFGVPLLIGRVTSRHGQDLGVRTAGGALRRIRARQIIGADGRASIVRRSLGYARRSLPISTFAGVEIDAELPGEGFGHLFVGPPGPILGYRIGPAAVRLLVDVPPQASELRRNPEAMARHLEQRLPGPLGPAAAQIARTGGVQWSAIRFQPRVDYGREGIRLVGDSVGHGHPLTAIGMTMGFADVAETIRPFGAFRCRRLRESYGPELLSGALYQVLADPCPAATSIRRALFRLLREHPVQARRMMGLLGCECNDPKLIAALFLRVSWGALTSRPGAVRPWQHARTLWPWLRWPAALLAPGGWRTRPVLRMSLRP